MASDQATQANRIAALEAAVAELREELERVRRIRVQSMRDTHRCPVCGETRILHFRQVRDVGQSELVSFWLQKQYSVLWGVQRTAGALEAFACCRCRLVEWHAISLDGVEIDGEEVVELTAPVESCSSGPYR